VTASEPVSMSRETTFEHDLHLRRDWQALAACLAELCRDVAADLRRRGYAGRTIGVKARYDDFRIVTRDQTLPSPTADDAAIRRAAFDCLGRVPPVRRLRLLGVRVGGLSRSGASPAVPATQRAEAPGIHARQGELPFAG
ncbi:MAG TPA: DNA polymerase IV, partial [Burkholderiaceae bacterium]|nr:DNA polymerase IV [Burkholderiaceae bacterium]